MFTTLVVMVKAQASGTRQRLIDATMGLVATHGFDGVSVGDIESAAGLAPRSGALYKYFASKLAVLEAGLEQHLDSIAEIEIDLAGTPSADPRAEIDMVARWLLAELDRERVITQVMEREGDRLPELRDRMRAGVSDRGYRIASTYIGHWAAGAGVHVVDPDALAVILIGAVINLRRSTWTFDQPPLGIDDERFLVAFGALTSTLLDLDH